MSIIIVNEVPISKLREKIREKRLEMDLDYEEIEDIETLVALMYGLGC